MAGLRTWACNLVGVKISMEQCPLDPKSESLTGTVVDGYFAGCRERRASGDAAEAGLFGLVLVACMFGFRSGDIYSDKAGCGIWGVGVGR